MDRVIMERVVDKAGGMDRCTAFAYDAAGRLVERTNGAGDSYRYRYDNCGRLISETDEEGAVTRYFHNRNGELIKAVSADNYDSLHDDGAGYTFSYDVFGRLCEVRDAFGQLCEENAYDEAGRLKGRYDAAGCVFHNEYDLGGRKSAVYDGEEKKPLQTYTYDSLGNITGITDGEQNHTEFELDAWGRITGIRNPDGSSESYTYDHAGNITSTTDGRGSVIRYEYNSMMKPGKVTDQAGNADTYTYDGEGNLTGQRDRNGRTVKREYGSFGMLLSEKGEDGTFTRRKYDTEGRLTECASSHMNYRYDYTKTGRLRTKYINGMPALRYTYTKAGRTASITDICGKTTEYGYDLNGRLASVSEKGKVLAAYAYDTAGRISNISFANGIRTSYSYDTERNLASMETRDRNGNSLLSYSYQYDRNGNRTGKKDLKNGNATAYVYDTMQRLSEVTYPETGKETYRYDEAGNRIMKQTQNYVEDYLYDERNRLTQKSVKNNTINSPTNPDLPEADNANIITYQYDLQGSLLKEESAGFCKQYLYNDFHQCIQTDVIRGREESAERLVQENLYDGEGLRFAIIENGRRTGFITDGWNNVAEIDENGRATKRIIRGMGIVASEDTEQKEDNIFTTAYHYYHGNERMDVEFITDEAGNVVNNYTYDAFGGIISSNETIPNRYTYNGEAFDKITEQYYLRKRYYNPKLCRFTQEDEYRGDGLNLYAFCANNPVMYVDPSGYKCETGAEADGDADETSGNTERLIPGTEGVVTGGDSNVLGQNMFKEMGLDPDTSRTGYQAQHIIPKELRNHPVIQKIGMDLDDASNGMFLRDRNSGGSSATSRHQGYHKQYTNIIEECLDNMDVNKSVLELDREVYNLQQSARNMMQDGTPIYMCDHVPASNSQIGRKSEKMYGISGSLRTEDFIRSKLEEYGF